MFVQLLFSFHVIFKKNNNNIVVRVLSKSEVRETSKVIKFYIYEVEQVKAWQWGVLSFCHCMFT